MRIVDDPDPALRFLLGSVGLPVIRRDHEDRLAEWEARTEVSSAAE